MDVQRDAPLEIRKNLRTVIDGAPVRSEIPDGWGPRDGPVVTVVGDGTPAGDRAWTRENVRVCVYAADEPTARATAAFIDSYLLDPHHVWGFSIHPGAGLIATRDQKLGCWIAAVTVRAASTREEMV
ncbi:MAG: hypothetical protein ACI38U_03160 [Corynebacterium sp.]|uniref:hypothetical protein n=1 Tax=Corynebacterium sp. TaxID=1720 RepID=UPI003EFBB533